MSEPESTNAEHELNVLRALCEQWACDDIDNQTTQLVRQKVEQEDWVYLKAGFNRPLVFGTAGLRGEVGPGPGRLNLSTISQVSWALGQYLLSVATEGEAVDVVLGFDARPDSARFALHAARVLSACGVRAVVAAEAIPTPLIAFAVRHLQASAGVVVTASHNPRGDNGYKVYDSQGVQIVAPWDTEIASLMSQAPPARHILSDSQFVETLQEQVLNDYFLMIDAQGRKIVPEVASGREINASPMKLAYSPLHGLGYASILRAFRGMGDSVSIVSVGSQVVPDGLFPTIAFPNPEEPGALDALLTLARSELCDAAFANDPDVDRFALCLPLAGEQLARLTGDALGLLFADACLRTTSLDQPALFSTIVSSPALEVLAERYGARVHRTLTGFKWICHAALESPRFLFAYEEALGYCFAAPQGFTTVMDKDGIGAAVVCARMLLQERGGAGMVSRLFAIYDKVGLWVSFGASKRFSGNGGTEEMRRMMQRIRASPPKTLLNLVVVGMTDYQKDAENRPWYLGAQDLLQFDMHGSEVHGSNTASEGKPSGSELSSREAELSVRLARVLVRPSGTEAKLKVYVHLMSEFRGRQHYATDSAHLESLAAQIASHFLMNA